MKLPFIKLTFRKKLITIFLLFSILPLLGVAILTTNIVGSNYRNALKNTFSISADLQQEILLNFLQSQVSWIDSLTTNKLLVSELDTYVSTASLGKNTSAVTIVNQATSKQDLLSYLSSIQKKNSYIEQAYFIDNSGHVLVSTSSDQAIDNSQSSQMLKKILVSKKAYIGKPFKLPSGKRILPLSVPFINLHNNAIAGFLVVELDESIIQSVLNGNFYIQSQALQKQLSAINTYVVDDNGYLIGTLNHTTIPTSTITSYPIQMCQSSQGSTTGFWKEYDGEEVYGVSRCLTYGDLHWTLVSEQPSSIAFAISNQLGESILAMALLVSILLIIVIIYVSKSISTPITTLKNDLEEVGKGNYDLKLSVQTNDEVEDLAKSFNTMLQILRQRQNDFKNVTVQREQEKVRITNERNMLAVILSGISDGVIAIDANKKILLFNKAVETLTGLGLQSASGKHIDDVLKFYDNIDLITAGLYLGQSEKIAQRFREKGLQISNYQNKKITVSLVTSPITLVDQSTGWIITFHDISKEVEGEELKIDFVSMAAHELRTPLTSVRGYASLLKMEKSKDMDDKGKEMLDRLAISGEILGNLVENLLNVTRIEQNRFTITPQNVDLTTTIKNAVDNLQQQAHVKNQKLELHMNGKLPIVFADQFRITQVVTNLVANAIHHTGEFGSITVKVEEQNNFLQVEVSDTGEGIPEDALPKLFTKFFRVSGNLNEGAKGTGLGLFISKSIIELHKGQIWVTSELGKGSTFTFILPKGDQGTVKN